MIEQHLPVGTPVGGGRYKIVRFIASGGFGATYEAVHVKLGKRVAIKEFFVRDFCNRDESTLTVTVGITARTALVAKLKQKFLDEARALCALNHPNIVAVHDVFEENRTAYYVMDYIDGPTLKQVVEQNGPLPEALALDYIRQVADALQYVHNQGRLHLDVKPGNIMTDGSGKAILIDFGASKQYDEVDGENTSTLIGKTPGYAPLEQMGNSVKKFKPSTDIYALGATLYKLLSGITPPEANLIVTDPHLLRPLPESISLATRQAVREAMQTACANRPQDIEEFLDLLDAEVIVIADDPPKPKHTQLPKVKWIAVEQFNDQGGKKRFKSRRRLVVFFYALALLGVAALGVTAYFAMYSTAFRSEYNPSFALRTLKNIWLGLNFIREGWYGGYSLRDEGVAVPLLLILASLLLLFVTAPFRSPVIRKIFNIESGDKKKKYRVVQNRDGQEGICRVGWTRVKRVLPMEYDRIHPMGHDAFICEKDSKYGLYNTKMKKMVLPLIFDKVVSFDDEKIILRLGAQDSPYSYKGFRIL